MKNDAFDDTIDRQPRVKLKFRVKRVPEKYKINLKCKLIDELPVKVGDILIFKDYTYPGEPSLFIQEDGSVISMTPSYLEFIGYYLNGVEVPLNNI